MRKFDVQVLLDLVDRFSGPLKSGPMKQLTALQKQSEITDRSMNRMFTGGGLIAAGAALGAPLIFSFNAASDLSEALNKNQVVFGQHARMVQRWANTSSTAFGQARVDALGTVGTFGNLFTSMGLGQRRAAGLSMDIVQLGGDLASFNNTSPTDALDALRSGLVGEIEPLRRYGVNLSAAAVAQKAFAMGLTPKVMNATEINPATKALATYQIILEQTKNAQGDYARTADGSANALRTILGLLKDLRTTVGTQLEPVFRPLILAFRDLLVFVNRLAQANPVLTRVLAVTTLGLAALLTLIGFGIITIAGFTLATAQARIGLITMRSALRGAVGGMIQFVTAGVPTSVQMQMMATRSGRLSLALQGVRARFLASAAAARAFTVSLLTNPVFLLIAAIVALGVSFVWAWRKSEDFRTGVMRSLQPIVTAWRGLMDQIAPLGELFGRVARVVGVNLDRIRNPLEGLGHVFFFTLGFILGATTIIFARITANVVNGFTAMLKIARGNLDIIIGLFTLDLPRAQRGAARVFGAIRRSVDRDLGAAQGFASRSIGAIVGLFGGDVPKAQAVTGRVFTAIRTTVSTQLAGVENLVSGTLGFIIGLFRGDLETVRTSAAQIWQGVKQVFTPQIQLGGFVLNLYRRGLEAAGNQAQTWGRNVRSWVGERFQTGGVAVGNFIGDLTSASTEGKPIWQSLLDKVTAPFSLPGVNRGKSFVPSLEGAATAGANLWATVKEQFPGFALPGLNRARNFVSSLTKAETAGGDTWSRIKGLFVGFALPGLNRQASFVPSLAGAEAAGSDAWGNIKKLFPAFSLPWLHHAVFKRSLNKANDEGIPIWQGVIDVLTAPFSFARGKRADFDKSLVAAEGSGKTIWGRVAGLLNVVIPIPGVDWSAVESSLGSVLDVIKNFGPQLAQAGRDLIGELIGGFNERIDELTNFLDKLKFPWQKDKRTAPTNPGERAVPVPAATATYTPPVANRLATPAAMRTPAATVLPGGAAGPQLLTPDFYRSLGTLDPASELGKMLAVGFAGGILNNQDVARYAARSMATGTIDEVRQKLQIRSPSRVFAGLGAFIPQGLGQGILGQRGAVTRAMQTLAAAAVAVPITPALGVAEVPSLAGPPPLTRPAVAAPGEAQTRTASGQTASGGAVHKTYSFAGANFNLDMSEIRGKEDFMGKLEELFQWFGDDE